MRSMFRSSVFPASALGVVILLAGCASSPRGRVPAIDPDVARADIERLLPAKIGNRSGWAVDIFAAFEALKLEPTAANTCAVVAVTEQESTFQANPTVPGLPGIARKEIEARAASHNIPKLLVDAALAVRSPDGNSYSARLDNARTEKALSDLYEDFISMVPLGGRLFANLNPVHTGGPMQVSIAYAEQHAASKRYPYPVQNNIRGEVFTRRGGMYFGIAHLLDYPATYDDMLFRFADYNAGHYSSRNVAFQSAANLVARTTLALDGDLLRFGSGADEPSQTELAVRKVRDRLDLSDAQIRSDLEHGEEEGFGETRLYSRMFALADKARGRPVPRAMVPRIRLQSPKITRKLTTDWFAHRVDERYKLCLSRGPS
ncbi:MAG: DUF1615 domain-containing protein [Gammaproteobacteria bacterium]